MFHVEHRLLIQPRRRIATQFPLLKPAVILASPNSDSRTGNLAVFVERGSARVQAEESCVKGARPTQYANPESTAATLLSGLAYVCGASELAVSMHWRGEEVAKRPARYRRATARGIEARSVVPSILGTGNSARFGVRPAHRDAHRQRSHGLTWTPAPSSQEGQGGIRWTPFRSMVFRHWCCAYGAAPAARRLTGDRRQDGILRL